MYSLKEVLAALESSWSQYTAFSAADWTPENPARGQCVVSSLIIQDIFGGELQKTKVSQNNATESHYRNILPDGTMVDATRSQYPDSQIFEIADINLGSYPMLREKLFAEANTDKRYKLLRTSVLSKLA